MGEYRGVALIVDVQRLYYSVHVVVIVCLGGEEEGGGGCCRAVEL